MIRPFDYSGITRDSSGICHYDERPASLVEMLRATVERTPRAEAIVEVGGERINYRELWDRSAVAAGGLRKIGIGRGDRVAIRLGNGLNWCLAFLEFTWPEQSRCRSILDSPNPKSNTSSAIRARAMYSCPTSP